MRGTHQMPQDSLPEQALAQLKEKNLNSGKGYCIVNLPATAGSQKILFRCLSRSLQLGQSEPE